ncbi:MAG TPA: hypothetical protein VGW78_02495 [Candidatus Babeliales bacterium]|jgi:hypothetical protein|nr:hypothetical protein [Candidatus Babeliales bacterium]
MFNAYKYTLLLCFLLIGSVYASEPKCDKVGSWIYRFYGSPVAKKNPTQLPYRFYGLDAIKNIKPKSQRNWISSSFNKPNIKALYTTPTDKQIFPQDVVQDMKNVLVPMVFEPATEHSTSVWRLPTSEDLKNSFQWGKNPFQIYRKFSDVWNEIIHKYIDQTAISCPIEKQKPIPYGSSEYFALLRKQKEQAKREEKILNEAIKTLTITQEASIRAKFANEKFLFDIAEGDWLKNSCDIQDSQICKNLDQLFKKTEEEYKLLRKNHIRADDLSLPLWKRKRFLEDTLRKIKQEEKVWKQD